MDDFTEPNKCLFLDLAFQKCGKNEVLKGENLFHMTSEYYSYNTMARIETW